MSEQKQDFYQKLRKKVVNWAESKEGAKNKWSKYIIWAPDLFYLLWKLSTDPHVPHGERTKLLAVLAYFISPIDLIPEAFLGPVGFTDDIVLAAMVLNGIVNKTDPEIVRRHWPGDEDVLNVIKNILGVADRMVGQKIWQKLQQKIK